MSGSNYSRIVDGAFKGLLVISVAATLSACGVGLVIGRSSEKAKARLAQDALDKAQLELTVERMRTDALQKQLDAMRADELYRQRSVSNVLLQIDDILRKVKP